jgi:hypothetical protein
MLCMRVRRCILIVRFAYAECNTNKRNKSTSQEHSYHPQAPLDLLDPQGWAVIAESKHHFRDAEQQVDGIDNDCGRYHCWSKLKAPSDDKRAVPGKVKNEETKK